MIRNIISDVNWILMGFLLVIPILGECFDSLIGKHPMFEDAGDVLETTFVMLLLGGIGAYISLQKIKEAKISREILIFKMLAEHSGQGLAMADLNSSITYINPTLCRILEEGTPEDVLGKNLIKYHPEHLKEFLQKEVFPTVMKEGQWQGELELLSAKGKITPTIENIFLIKNKVGEPLFFADVITTITERKRMERNLEKALIEAKDATQAKSQFLANMSHEIRTPLNAIIGFVTLTQDDKNLSEESKDNLKTLKSSSLHLLRLINEILDLSKVEAGMMELEQTSFSLEAIMDNVRSNAAAIQRREQKNIPLKIDYDSSISDYLWGDPTRILQVLSNLVANAIKFTEKGSILIGVFLKNSELLEFYIQDTGIGIAKDKQKTIFESFQQTDLRITRKYGGTGLGLAMAKYLVELWDGEIWVDSEPGKGSRFTFTMPYKPTDKIERERIEIKQESISDEMKNNKILIAEDNLINQKLVKRMLEKHGFANVIFAKDGEQALEKYKSEKPAIILMDVQMPNKDGLQATREIRAWENESKKTHVPIIALTAGAMKGDRDLCLDSGCSDYATKPIDRDILIDLIIKYLS